ncbi:MAG: hypothetical protein JNJ58_06315 [Chitinophagaceae bacterium]|nr:hypothetical protein [Chitinophagaceae bacterium]
MSHTRCNYCGQVVQFVEIRGNSTCPVCRQSSTSCCEGGSCTISYTEPIKERVVENYDRGSEQQSAETPVTVAL